MLMIMATSWKAWRSALVEARLASVVKSSGKKRLHIGGYRRFERFGEHVEEYKVNHQRISGRKGLVIEKDKTQDQQGGADHQQGRTSPTAARAVGEKTVNENPPHR
jgi:hypothetical protein